MHSNKLNNAASNQGEPPHADFMRRFQAAVDRDRRRKYALFTRGRRTAGVFFLTAVTLAYLIVEFGFSAWLLDIMAQNSPEYIVHRAEHRGRLLSGFAVALLFWPVILARTRIWWSTALTLAIVSSLIIFGVYQGERYLIDTVVEKSSAQSRAAAVTGSLLRQGLATGTVNGGMLDGLWADQNAQSTAGKAFVGVVAYMVAQSQSAQQQAMAIAPTVVKGVIDQKIGGLEAAYTAYTDSQAHTRRQYNLSYKLGLERHNKRVEGTRAYANRTWEQYLDRLDAKNPAWGRARIGKHRGGELVPAFVSPRVRREVREQGIPVAESWSTGDKATFVYLVEKNYREKLSRGLEVALDGLPANLTLEKFVVHPKVQKKWRESLGYSDQVPALSLAEITSQEFGKRYYEPMLAGRTDEQLKTYHHRADSYGPGQPQEAEGKRAYEATIAPLFGLTLSLLGALVHLCKTGLLMLQASTGWRFRSGLVKGLFVFLIVISASVLAATIIRTPLTSHPTYQAWTQAGGTSPARTAPDRLLTTSLDAMIKMQSVAYPVFNAFRNGLEGVLKAVH